jgi:hypothetical protein
MWNVIQDLHFIIYVEISHGETIPLKSLISMLWTFFCAYITAHAYQFKHTNLDELKILIPEE